jgi:hypothetical protein
LKKKIFLLGIKMAKNYARIIDFGKGINQQAASPLNPANPLSYCMFPTLNSQFIHGSTSSGLLYDTNNAACTNFMAERCTDSWDGFCDAYQALNVDTYWPNTASIDSEAFELAQYFIQNRPSVGDNLVRNTMYRRFLQLPQECPSVQPFDPNVAASPNVTIFQNLVASSSQLHHLEDVDNDPWISKMVENPRVCFDVLARIYLGVQRKEPAASKIPGTLFAQFLERNAGLFQRFLEVALPRLQSFQEGNVAPKCQCGRPCV